MPEIAARLEQLMSDLRSGDPVALASSAAHLRAAFHGASIPDEINDAVLAAVHSVTARALAVRSSATAEDLPGISFAGQQETYLNVIGEEALLDAVRKCWASLWTDRAIAYRQRNDVPQDRVALAVVLQRMVPARMAGVLFTANPVSGKRSELRIEASFGLGEAVVSGLVSPDSYLLDKKDMDVISRKMGAKRVQVTGLPEGGTAQVAVGEEAEEPALIDDGVLALARMGAAIEEHFGFPQDIEWAISDGRVHILQTRPITSLYPAPPPSRQLRVYLSFNAIQGVWEPLSPMGASFFSTAAWTIGLRGGSGQRLLIDLGGRLYGDVTGVFGNEMGRGFVKAMLPEIEPVAARTLLQLMEQLETGQPQSTHSTRTFLLRNWRTAVAVASRIVRFVMFPEQARSHIDKVVAPRLTKLRSKAEHTSALDGQNELVSRVAGDGFAAMFLTHMVPVIASGILCYKQAQGLVNKYGLDQHLFAVARQGLPYNVTTQMDLGLWRLTQAARRDNASRSIILAEPPASLGARYLDGSLPEPVQQGMRAFLDRYGHRAVREIDVGMPRWREDPSYLFGVLQNYLALEDPEQAPDRHFAEQALARERAVSQLVEEARRLPGGWYKARVLGFLLRRFRDLGGLRETPKFYMVWLFEGVREALLAAGRQLAEMGLLDHREDVFFLKLEELSETASTTDLRQTVVDRRRDYNMELRRGRAPRVITSEGEAFYGEAAAEGGMALNGTPASPGTARGVARVIYKPIGARIQPGEILVAPSTDPAWTPLFLTAGGLVMEAGGMMSHGSIVAREYGIPAVVGVIGATSRIADGQELEVDGDQGRVVLLSLDSRQATS